MRREILAEIIANETRIIVLEDGRPLDIFIERESKKSIIGNIYLGRVQKCSKGISAAFVDIGLKKSGFLPLRKGQRLNEGELVKVQITRDAYGEKGPQLTQELSISGRFLVYKPSGNKVSVSKKILDDNEKRRLLSILGCQTVQEECWIARTLSVGVGELELKSEIFNLRRIWNILETNFAGKTYPGIFYQEISPVIKTLRDHVAVDVNRIVISGVDDYTAAKNWCRNFAPEISKIIESYNGQISLFQKFGVQEFVDDLLENKIMLPSGGNIIIEPTEALTVIDVNSGANLDGSISYDNALMTNLEAAKECCRQIRLRNISGIIIIDFVKSENADMWCKITNIIKGCLAKDRVPARVLGKTDAGLLEIIRKRSSPPLTEIVCQPCKFCNGNGYEAQPEFLIFSIIADLRQMRDCHQGGVVLVEASLDIINCLQELYSSGKEMAIAIGIGCLLDYKVDHNLPCGKYQISHNQM